MKRNVFILIIAVIGLFPLYSQNEPLKILVIGAHPDDCDIRAGGTAIQFAKMGHKVKFISCTNGDAGHQSQGGGALAKRRMAEAKEAGKRFGVEYYVMDNHDGELMPTLENRLNIIREIRKWKADVVITHRSNDYHPDHRYTSILVQDAAFMVIVPNVAPDTPPLKKNPVFLYLKDNFKKPSPFKPDIAIGIDDVFEQKIYALAAHESQFFEWLPWIRSQEALNNVPKGEKERIEWLASKRKSPVNNDTRACLERWYGKEQASKIKNVEAFEICEYGRQPSDDEIKTLFPMLGK